MSFHRMKSMNNVTSYTPGMSQCNPMTPKIPRYPVCSNGNLREEALKELSGTVSPSTLNFENKGGQLLLLILHQKTVLVPLAFCSLHRRSARVVQWRKNWSSRKAIRRVISINGGDIHKVLGSVNREHQVHPLSCACVEALMLLLCHQCARCRTHIGDLRHNCFVLPMFIVSVRASINQVPIR